MTVALAAVRGASLLAVAQPGYTDSYYFTNVALRLAHGHGLTVDFLWSPLESLTYALPAPSHQFWVPLATVLGAVGIALAEPLLGAFRAAQLPFVALALLLPALAYAAARSLGASANASLVAAAVAGLGGLFAPGLVAVDAFVPAALLGTAFFLVYARAAEGSVRAGLVCGALVGLLYLARAEGALFGVALLALLRVPRARAAGLGGSAVALAIGGAWLLRELSLGVGTRLFARTSLITRYEEFFAIQPAYGEGTLADILLPKASALVTNAGTLVFVFALVLVVPLALGLRARWSRPDVRAWAALVIAIYLLQSLVWTLHSTRGSYFHSLAAFFPFGVALAVAEGERLASRGRAAAGWAWGTIALVAVMSAASVQQWDAVFNAGTRERVATLPLIPDGPFLAIDGAAWRWISGRTVAVTPADGLERAGCMAAKIGARSIVLEAAHFSRYDDLYTRDARPAWLGAPAVRGATKVYPIVGTPPCGRG